MKNFAKDLFVFQHRLDAGVFLLTFGAAILFALVLIFGFLAQFLGAKVTSDVLEYAFLLLFLLLLGFVCHALFTGQLVRWANALLKLKTGPGDLILGLSFLSAKLVGSLYRRLIKFFG